MSAFLDLHTHSTVSDGTDSPPELIRKAAALGLKAVALTDHDALDGLEEAAAAARRHDLRFIPGCELAVHEPRHGELHLVGLWVRPSANMCDALRRIRDHRLLRNRMMLERLNTLGLSVSMADVLIHSRGVAPGRPHIAGALHARGYTRSLAEAFDRYIGEGRPAFVPRTLLSPEEGIRLLTLGGATAALAHPFLRTAMTPETLASLLEEYRGYGLTALEAYHSAHTNQHVRQCLLLAKTYGLLLTGGSDYHGDTKPDTPLGRPRIPEILLEHLENDRQNRGLWI